MPGVSASPIEPYYDLGSYQRPTDTPSADAQVWVDRGMVWAYAFNHDEAIACFERALALDPDFALARWGIAYAVGPNYNKAWEAFDPVDLTASVTRARAELAQAARGRADVVERGLIDALMARFPTDDPDDTVALQAGHAAYADAMTTDPHTVTDEQVDDLRRRFGDDGVIELTYQIGVENMRSRMYSALGITEQGFNSGDACRVPWAE